MRTSPASDVLDAGLHLGRCFVTWTKLDDLWCERRELAAINFADRWHYLAMIQFCSRADLRDGVMRGVDARRCSDHPDPNRALAELGKVGLIVADVASDTYSLIEVDAHLPVMRQGRRPQTTRSVSSARGSTMPATIRSASSGTATRLRVTSRVTVTRMSRVTSGRDGTGRDWLLQMGVL